MTVTSTFVAGQVLTAADANNMSNSGLTYVASATFAGAGTKSINSCFDSTFTNYRIIVQIDSVSANSVVALRWRSGGADNVTAQYYWSLQNMLWNATTSTNGGGADTSWTLLYTNTTIPAMAVIEACGPQKAQPTFATVASSGDNSAHTSWVASAGGHFLNTTYQATGLTVFTSSGTMQGTITVYGYRQA
jgi:hypothetical protein